MTLQLIGLSKRYGKEEQPALRQIDLTVAPGEFVAILGRSGAGKSTLIRCVNLLVRPTEGKVVWNGRDLTAASPRALSEARREMGMIFQQFNLIAPLSVLTNVLVGAFPALPLWRCVSGLFPREAVDRAMEVLDRVGIARLAHRRAKALSGGQQQRVAIARALMLHPGSSSAMSPSPTWIRYRRGGSWNFWPPSTGRKIASPCSTCTMSAWPRPSPPGSSGWPRDGSCLTALPSA